MQESKERTNNEDANYTKYDFFSLERRILRQETVARELWQREKHLSQELMLSSTRGKDAHVQSKRSQEILCKHVDTISTAVKSLNQEMQHLRTQLNLGDHQLELQDRAVRGLGRWCTDDIRGRIGRCDQAIMELMLLVKCCQRDILQVQKHCDRSRKELKDQVQELTTKVAGLQTEMATARLESDAKHKQLEGLLSQQLFAMETRLKGQVSDVGTRSTQTTQQMDTRVDRQQSLFLTRVELFQTQLDAKHRELQSSVHAELKRLEQALENEKKRNHSLEEGVKKELEQQQHHSRIMEESVHSKTQQVLMAMQGNMRVMKSVMDDKISVLESNMHRHRIHTTMLLK